MALAAAPRTGMAGVAGGVVIDDQADGGEGAGELALAQAVLDGRIQIVLAEFEPEAAPVSLIHAGQELTPLKVRMLLDFAAPRLRARLA